MLSALRIMAQQQDAVSKKDREAPAGHAESWDPARLQAAGSSIAVLSAAQAQPAELFSGAVDALFTDGSEHSPVLTCLGAYLCHTLVALAVDNSDVGKRFVSSVLTRLLCSSISLCETVACDLIPHYIVSCRDDLVTLFISSLKAVRNARRGQEQDGPAVSPQACSRACACLVKSLSFGTDSELLLNIFDTALNKVTSADPSAVRAIINVLLPSFFEASEATDANATAEYNARILRAAGTMFKASNYAVALQLLCRLPGPVLTLPLSDAAAEPLLEALRAAASSKSATVRKRVHHLLSVLAASAPGTSSDPASALPACTLLQQASGWTAAQWDDFLAVLDAAENSSAHLITAVWQRIPSLLPPASANATQAQGRMRWVEVLFARGLAHRSLTFRKLCLQSLASSAMDPAARLISSDFLVSTVLGSMDDPSFLRLANLAADNLTTPIKLAHPLLATHSRDWPSSSSAADDAAAAAASEADGSDGTGVCFAHIIARALALQPSAAARAALTSQLLARQCAAQAPPRSLLLLLASLALCAELDPASIDAPALAPQGASPRAPGGRRARLVAVDAEGAREVVGVLLLADRSCRHTPMQAGLYAAALRLLASASAVEVQGLVDCSALLNVFPQRDLARPRHAAMLAACAARLRPAQGAEGAGSSSGLAAVLADALPAFLLHTSSSAAASQGAQDPLPPSDSECATIRLRADQLARLVVLCQALPDGPDSGSGRQLETAPRGAILAPLLQRLTELASHAYLPPSAAERAVALLSALLANAAFFAPLLRGSAHLPPPRRPPAAAGTQGPNRGASSVAAAADAEGGGAGDSGAGAPDGLGEAAARAVEALRARLLGAPGEHVGLAAAATQADLQRGSRGGEGGGGGGGGGGVRGMMARMGLRLELLELLAEGGQNPAEMRQARDSLLSAAREALRAGGSAGAGALRVLRSLAEGIGLPMQEVGVMRGGRGMSTLAEEIAFAEVGEPGEGVGTREAADVGCVFAGERLAALRVVLEAAAKHAGEGEGKEEAAEAKRRWKRVLERVLEEAEGAARDGYGGAFLRCAGLALPGALGLRQREMMGEGALREGVEVELEVVAEAERRCWGLLEQLQLGVKLKGGTRRVGGWNQVSLEELQAYMQVAFHPEVWALRGAHAAGAGSVLKEAWHRCWALGGRLSQRLVKVLVTHVSGLWRAFPETAAVFAREVAECCAYGLSVVSDSTADVASDGLAALSEDLACSSDSFLLEGRETFVRVLVVRALTLLRGAPDVVGAALFAVANALLDLNESKELSVFNYLAFSQTHRVKNRIWQALAVISPLQRGAHVDAVAARVMAAQDFVERKSVRFYMELSAFEFMRRRPALIPRLLLPALRQFNALAPPAASLMVTSNFLFRAFAVPSNDKTQQCQLLAGNPEAEKAIFDLGVALLPWVSHHTHHVRVLASLALKFYHHSIRAAGSGSTLEDGLLGQASLDFMEGNDDVAKLHDHLSRLFFQDLDLDAMSRLDSIFLQIVSDGQAWGEQVPPGMTQDIETEMNDYHRAFLAASAPAAAQAQETDVESGGAVQRKYQPEALEQMKLRDAGDSAGSVRADGRAAAEDGAEGEGGAKLKGDLIVVASLIDKMPNLAGLARTCEVFQTSALVVHDRKKMLADPVFKQVAVSAERWMRCDQVEIEALPRFLAAKRESGYTIIALEQASDSIPLHEYKFPSRAVLLLGKEKEGVPQPLLHLVDVCLEIPQQGIIRSLNVHVSAACSLWQWRQQYL